jgi:hypothetical protein
MSQVKGLNMPSLSVCGTEAQGLSSESKGQSETESQADWLIGPKGGPEECRYESTTPEASKPESRWGCEKERGGRCSRILQVPVMRKLQA